MSPTTTTFTCHASLIFFFPSFSPAYVIYWRCSWCAWQSQKWLLTALLVRSQSLEKHTRYVHIMGRQRNGFCVPRLSFLVVSQQKVNEIFTNRILQLEDAHFITYYFICLLNKNIFRSAMIFNLRKFILQFRLNSFVCVWWNNGRKEARKVGRKKQMIKTNIALLWPGLKSPIHSSARCWQNYLWHYHYIYPHP